MTLDEIKLREQRVRDAENNLRQRKIALESAQAEYAEQEARKAGIVYGETRVMREGRGPFLVVGFGGWRFGEPEYRLAKIKSDGTPSRQSCGQYGVRLDELEAAE